MEPLRVLLADDQILFRKAIVSLLSFNDEIVVVGEASNGFEAIELAEEKQPDVILMDLNMPGCSGLEALCILKKKMPSVKVIMLTISDDDNDLFDSVKNGAEGYLLKNMEPQQLFDMLARVRQGVPAFEGPVAAKIFQEFRKPTRAMGKTREADNELTQRETRVLELLVEGATNSEIAAALFISENTVKLHLRNIFTKLQLKNRIQAAVYAVRHGLVPEVKQND